MRMQEYVYGSAILDSETVISQPSIRLPDTRYQGLSFIKNSFLILLYLLFLSFEVSLFGGFSSGFENLRR
jgi:hypothetical protein